ncbi:MAG TPA: bacteriohopanetetrol glucosamine biosynthesis glycosyltransferase HpnI [Vicinamibacteria bacterium]|nr:bacteriohopanetetrol glucosamine biosynthesis glycosyltransferase HpnI [Vicinamibacteria bacterium]
MLTLWLALQWALLLPVAGGSVYAVLCLAAVLRLRRGPGRGRAGLAFSPPVTVLKPIHGLEKGLEENLRSTCQQDYPEFQVIFSVQRKDDPALPLLLRLQQEFGSAKVDVVVDDTQTAPNGKIRNLLGALPRARHTFLVISDSDVRLRPDYLVTIVPLLAEPGVGCACTFYKAVGAQSWYEALEQLTLNADFVPSLVFAAWSGASRFVLGASTALSSSVLAEIGGLAALSDYLVEDFEMGRRILAAGKRIVVAPYFVDTIVDLKSPRQWWNHQVYWDQNTRSANPWGFLGTVLVRSVPFALLFAVVRLFDPLGWEVLAGALAVRLLAAAVTLRFGLGDGKSVGRLGLLPLRDLAGLVSWALAFIQPTVIWRGEQFNLTPDGRMVAREPLP